MPAQREDIVAGDGVPELDAPVVAGRGQAAAVGEVGDGGHQPGVPLELADQAAVVSFHSQMNTSAAGVPRYWPPTEARWRPSGE